MKRPHWLMLMAGSGLALALVAVVMAIPMGATLDASAPRAPRVDVADRVTRFQDPDFAVTCWIATSHAAADPAIACLPDAEVQPR